MKTKELVAVEMKENEVLYDTVGLEQDETIETERVSCDSIRVETYGAWHGLITFYLDEEEVGFIRSMCGTNNSRIEREVTGDVKIVLSEFDPDRIKGDWSVDGGFVSISAITY